MLTVIAIVIGVVVFFGAVFWLFKQFAIMEARDGEQSTCNGCQCDSCSPGESNLETAADRIREILEDASALRDNDYRAMQEWVGEWTDRVLKPKGVTLMGTYKHLLKEVEELGVELEKWVALENCTGDYGNIGAREELREKIAKETADIDIVTCHIAHQVGFIISYHFLEKMDINEKRQWSEANSEGVSQHVD